MKIKVDPACVRTAEPITSVIHGLVRIRCGFAMRVMVSGRNTACFVFADSPGRAMRRRLWTVFRSAGCP
jgi:hypothetical protein